MSNLNTDIANHLEALAASERFVVDAVLKETAIERTERVYAREDDGTMSGPYVRKRFSRTEGAGSVYARLFAASEAGVALRHIPRILDCHDEGEEQVVVMDFVSGETLYAVVARCGASPALAVDVGIRLCDALSELHTLFDPPIIHRDVKPSNIMLAENALYLIDFGISRSYARGASCDTAYFGTRGFAPPEQFGFGQTDPRSDLYSAGAVLAYCACGSATNAVAFEKARVPESLRAVVKKAMALDPAERFQTAADLKRALARVAIELGMGAADSVLARPAKARDPESSASPAASREALAPSTSPAAAEQAVRPAAAGAPSRAGGVLACVRRFFSSIPVGVGIAWNVVLGLSFLLYAAVFVSLVADPAAAAFAADAPAIWRAACYGPFIFVGLGALLILMSDRRLLHRRFPRIFRLSYVAESVILAAISAAGGIAMVLVVLAYGAIG